MHVARIVTFLVLPVLAVGFAVFQYRSGVGQHRLDRIASEIAGRPVRVHCPNAISAVLDQSPEDGMVLFRDGRPYDYTDVKRYVCQGVLRFARGGRDAEAAKALLVLTHESEHLAGHLNEAVAECYALQRLPQVDRELGARPAEAEAVARYDLATFDPLLPGEYHSPECRDGGTLDVRPADSTWP